MNTAPFKLLEPAVRTSNVVFTSPHSGRDYSRSFLRQSILDRHTIRSSEDAFVDLLFGYAPSYGSPLLAAVAPRSFIDLNRSATELDPLLINDVDECTDNPRVASGLGVIPRVVMDGRPIYRDRIRLDEAHRRIEEYWQPYHRRLQKLLNDVRKQFGEVVLIDCHSMPHAATESTVGNGTPNPEIVLGDRFGTSARKALVDRVEAAFSGAGLSVMRNTPFAGAYTAKHYGRPSKGQHVIQVEIDRSLYMNERRIVPSKRFESFRSLMREVTAEITLIGRQDMSLAAE